MIYDDDWYQELYKNAKIIIPSLKSIVCSNNRSEYYKNKYTSNNDQLAMSMASPLNYAPGHKPITFLDAGYVNYESKNSCPCIVYTVYFNRINDDLYNALKTHKMYLETIYTSIKTIRETMPGWLVRVYFDEYVYSMLNNNSSQDTSYILAKSIVEYDNVESYFVSCGDDYTLQRALRLLPLLDKYISVTVARDADSLFTCVDAINYLKFADDEKYKLFFYSHLHNDRLSFASDWHKISYNYNIHEIYNNKTNDFSGSHKTTRTHDNNYPYNIAGSLLCGLFACKIHVTSDLLAKIINKISLNTISAHYPQWTTNYKYSIYDEIILNIMFSPLLVSYHKINAKKHFITPETKIDYKFDDYKEIIHRFSKLPEINHLSLAVAFTQYLLEKGWQKESDYIANVQIDPATLQNILDKIPSSIPRNTKYMIDCESTSLLNLAIIWHYCPWWGTLSPNP